MVVNEHITTAKEIAENYIEKIMDNINSTRINKTHACMSHLSRVVYMGTYFVPYSITDEIDNNIIY